MRAREEGGRDVGPRARHSGDADVVVVGAGPAGAITALLLAGDGIDVLLVDRAEFPRPKACGDCLSAGATRLLEEMGLLGRVLAAGAAGIERWDIVAPNGRVATGSLDHPALALERRRLDAALLEAALEAGARFRQARVVALHRTAGRVDGVELQGGARLGAPLVVGADGLRSVVARELGVIRRTPRLRKVSLTAHIPTPDGTPMRHGEMHVFDGGCVGLAPAGPDTLNLTLVVTGDRAGSLAAMGATDFFHDCLRALPRLARFADVDPGPLLASGPFDWPTRSPVAAGAALVGDAAGYYDPFTGQGVHHAMAGARLLALEVAPILARNGDLPRLDQALQRYARARKRLTRPARRVQRAVEIVVARPWLANRVLGRLARATAAMDRIIEVTGDLRPPRSLISPAVVSSFLFPPARRANDPH